MTTQTQNAAQTQTLNVNGIVNASVNINASVNDNIDDSAWEDRKKEALAAWREGNECGWKFVRAAGNAACCNKDLRPLEWALEQRTSVDPLIKAGAVKTCQIIEAIFFGDQPDGKMDFIVPAGASKLNKRTAEDFTEKKAHAQWLAMRGVIRTAWLGGFKCRRDTAHRTDKERLNAAARVLAQLLEAKKATKKEIDDAIEAARAELRAKAK